MDHLLALSVLLLGLTVLAVVVRRSGRGPGGGSRPAALAAVLALGVPGSAGVGVAVASKGTVPPDSLSIRFMVSPLVGFAPLRIRATSLVRDPKQELSCPKYGWDWGDGSTSSEAASCDPYELEDQRPTRYSPVPREHLYYAPGDYLLTFSVSARGQTRRAVQSVSVHGGGRMSRVYTAEDGR